MRVRQVIAVLTVCVATWAVWPAPGLAKRRGKPVRRGAWVIGRVAQVTATEIYVNIGSRFGLKVGDPVQVLFPNRTKLLVTLADVRPKSARARLPEKPPRWPRPGLRVRARWRSVAKPTTPTTPTRRVKPKKLPAPEAPETLAARWHGVSVDPPQQVVYQRPATRHSTRPSAPHVRGSLRLEYMGLYDLDSAPQSNYHRIGLWSDLDVPKLFADWLNYSHRVRLRFDMASDLNDRPFQNSRPIPLVYRLRLGFGAGPFRGALGRTMGAPVEPAPLIDGGVARVRVARGVYVGAYGGLQPGLDDLAPSTRATGFGGYTSFRLAGASAGGWSLSADAGFVGSTWRGTLDRTAATAQASLDTPKVSLHAQTTVDFYPSEHPSELDSVDLSTLSLHADTRLLSWLRLGARYDHYRLVPTRETLELLGADYALQRPVDGVRGFVDVDLSQRAAIGASGGWDGQSESSWVAWGELMLRYAGVFSDTDWLRASFLGHGGNLLRGYGGRLLYEIAPLPWLTTWVAYALHHDAYSEFDGSTWRHSPALGMEFLIARRWIIGAQTEAALSDEEQVLQLFATAAFHF